MLVISNRPRATPDYALNCTPLSPITITNQLDLSVMMTQKQVLFIVYFRLPIRFLFFSLKGNLCLQYLSH